MDQRRQVVHQEGQGIVDLRRIDEVVVVQHEDGQGIQLAQVVDQRGQDRVGRRRLRLPEFARYALADGRVDGLQGRDEIGQEAGDVMVLRVQRQPRRRVLAGRDPGADDGRLAESGRRRYESELPGRARLQALEETPARDERWPGRRNVELGAQDRIRHGFMVGRDAEKSTAMPSFSLLYPASGPDNAAMTRKDQRDDRRVQPSRPDPRCGTRNS